MTFDIQLKDKNCLFTRTRKVNVKRHGLRYTGFVVYMQYDCNYVCLCVFNILCVSSQMNH